MKGLILHKFGRKEEARKCFRKAVKLVHLLKETIPEGYE